MKIVNRSQKRGNRGYIELELFDIKPIVYFNVILFLFTGETISKTFAHINSIKNRDYVHI